MPILKVSNMGHPILRKKTKFLSKKQIISLDIKSLISNMKLTLTEYQGVGLAAPQVFENMNVALIGTFDKKKLSRAGGVKSNVIFNATYISVDDEKIGVYEGCLSIPGIRAYVPRHSKILVNYTNSKLKEVSETYSGFEAIVYQHEIDHLNGVLFIDRCDHETLCFDKEYERYHSV